MESVDGWPLARPIFTSKLGHVVLPADTRCDLCSSGWMSVESRATPHSAAGMPTAMLSRCAGMLQCCTPCCQGFFRWCNWRACVFRALATLGRCCVCNCCHRAS